MLLRREGGERGGDGREGGEAAGAETWEEGASRPGARVWIQCRGAASSWPKPQAVFPTK